VTAVIESIAEEEIWLKNISSIHSEECAEVDQIWTIRFKHRDKSSLDIEVGKQNLML
jgi:hypothetical protein